MRPQVTLKVEIGEAENEDGYVLSGVIQEDIEVLERDDFVEPEVVDYVNENFNVEVENTEWEFDE